MTPFFTIGHSNRSLDEFAGLLRATDVRRIVDVRAFLRSRTQPQFNIDALPRIPLSVQRCLDAERTTQHPRAVTA
ncbi:DUF488 family protein [Dyella silvae]|uniref:DUF488 family protein n=1 Tax=Dyella silvae TaxID=2994424 RepID=UPI0022645206|nr:DUF488 family protein [Dyella silvae]